MGSTAVGFGRQSTHNESQAPPISLSSLLLKRSCLCFRSTIRRISRKCTRYKIYWQHLLTGAFSISIDTVVAIAKIATAPYTVPMPSPFILSTKCGILGVWFTSEVKEKLRKLVRFRVRQNCTIHNVPHHHKSRRLAEGQFTVY